MEMNWRRCIIWYCIILRPKTYLADFIIYYGEMVRLNFLRPHFSIVDIAELTTLDQLDELNYENSVTYYFVTQLF